MDRFIIRKRKSPAPSPGPPSTCSESDSLPASDLLEIEDNDESSEAKIEINQSRGQGDVSVPAPSKKRYRLSAPNVRKLTETFSWLDLTKDYLFCTYCQIKLSGNKFHLSRHEKNALHLKIFEAARKTPAITACLLQEPSQQKKYNAVKEAELRLCCYIAEKNLPMLLMDTLPLLNKELYPDSNIAKNVNMKRLKATKLITGVLGPALKAEIIDDLKNEKFSIIIDETTDLSTKKSLVIVTRYWKQGKIQDRFLDLVEVEEATGEALFNVIKKNLDDNTIPFENVIGFASDNASTMMGAVKGVQARFKQILPHLYVQGCTCHSLHLCSSAAAKKLPNTVEQFTRDIYAYFAHSNKRISELKECQVFTDENPHKMLYPSQTRWLSLKNVVDRILEHWNSLTLFFQRAALEDNLPSAKTILNALRNQEYKLYLLFLGYVLDLTNKVNIELQSESPKLPILLSRISALYKTLLRCFIKNNVLDKTSIQSINLNDPANYVALDNLFAGAKVDALINSENLTVSREGLHSFRLRVLDFYLELCKEIKNRFKFDDVILKYASNFTPTVALSGEVISIANFINFFPQINIDIEAANAEWQLLSELTNISHNNDINLFWRSVSEQKNALGELMFPNLLIIVKVILALPHSSATAERVFSQLSLIKTFLRNKLLISTCAALLHVKDKMKNYENGVLDWKPDNKIFNYTNTFVENIVTE